MYPEADLIPISALQHLLFCERQCALIHVERLWVENRLTTEGNHLHKKAHEGPDETRDGVRVTRGLQVRSFRLGLAGQCDIVTWQPPDDRQDSGVQKSGFLPVRKLPGRSKVALDGWTITPIEYKRGRPKKDDCDRVQLAAQALCLEEMLGVSVAWGELFYGQKRRRTLVDLDDRLRDLVHRSAARLHELFDSGVTPPAIPAPKCESCSLVSLCLPSVTNPARKASRFVGRQFAAHLRSDGPTTDVLDSTLDGPT